MGKFIRVILVVVALVVMVAIGMRGTAWADRLTPGSVEPAGLHLQNQPAASRPQGTVITGPTVVAVTPGQRVAVGSCATVFTATAPAGVTFTATVVDATTLPGAFPGALVGCGIRIDAMPVSGTLGAEVEVCFPVGPTITAFGHHYDGTNWLKTAEALASGQSCVKVPLNDPNPSFAALFQQ